MQHLEPKMLRINLFHLENKVIVFRTVAVSSTRFNIKNTCKLRKQLRQFYNTRDENAHNNQIKKRSGNIHNTGKQRNALQIQFFIWLCYEHLQHLL